MFAEYLKGRGAQIHPDNPFLFTTRSKNPSEYLDPDNPTIRTIYQETVAKTIVNKVPSPDIGMEYSMNPYQGCEHGCVYCYARNTHPYWGYDAGLDFESKILVKQNAPELLIKHLNKKNWKAAPIMLSGNTDCYQPIERKLQITRKLLKVFLSYKHPVGLITKSQLLLRDLDLLKKLNEHNLVKVAVSINTLQDDLRKTLEPRTSSIQSRLKMVKELVKNKIPVTVMMAPLIPDLNTHEIIDMVKLFSKMNVNQLLYIVIRLNGDVEEIFNDWLLKNFPDRAEKVMNKISSLHGGKTNDSRFRTRMKGEGNYAKIIADQFNLAKKKYFTPKDTPYNTTLFANLKDRQLSLFK
jgi:DNA repair photolyase